MLYTKSKLISTENHDDGEISVHVALETDDATGSMKKEFNVATVEDLKIKSIALLASANLEQTLKGTIGQYVDLTPVTKIDPTPKDIYLSNISKLFRMLEIQRSFTDLGDIKLPALDQDVAALLEVVAGQYKSEYYA